MPVGEVVNYTARRNEIVSIGPRIPRVVLAHHIANPNRYEIGDIVLVPERAIRREESGLHTCAPYSHRLATPIEEQGYRSPVTRMDFVLYDPRGYVLCLGRWRDIIQDFGVAGHDLLFHEKGEGTLFDKMFALMYASDLPPNLRRAAIIFEENRIPNEVMDHSWGLEQKLENLVKEKLPKST